MYKRMLCLLLAAVIALALAACGDADPTEATEPTAATAATEAQTEPQTQDPSRQEETDGINMTEFIRTFDRGPLIEEQVVYESDRVVVTAVSLRYDPINGAAVTFRGQNKSARELLVQADTCAVNGYMAAVDFSLAVPAGKSAEGEMFIPYAALALAGTHSIATIEVSLVLVDQSTFEILAACETAEMLTTGAEGYEPTFDDEGQTVYDDKNVRIVLKGIDSGRQVSDETVLIVYMYNGADRSISVQVASLLVNGYEMTPVMTTTVMPGKHAVDVVTFFDMDLQEHGIEEIETVEIGFRIVDEDTWQTIAETKPVALENI